MVRVVSVVRKIAVGGGSSGEVNSQNAREQGGHNSVLADDVGSAI